jgi:hypothetical protein
MCIGFNTSKLILYSKSFHFNSSGKCALISLMMDLAFAIKMAAFSQSTNVSQIFEIHSCTNESRAFSSSLNPDHKIRLSFRENSNKYSFKNKSLSLIVGFWFLELRPVFIHDHNF